MFVLLLLSKSTQIPYFIQSILLIYIACIIIYICVIIYCERKGNFNADTNVGHTVLGL